MGDVRQALALLPRGAITGIGSLPHTQMELALQMALSVDVPYLPQLPAENPSELMVPAALEGLPGLHAGEDGACTVDLGGWEAGRGELESRIDAAVRSGEASSFLPGVNAARALRPFLWEVRERKLAFAKAQLAGPATVRWSSRLSSGAPLSEHPGMDAQVFRLLLVRSLALVQALRAAGATAIFYLDEPRAVARFLDRGGAFSLGLVPTDLGQEADPDELARAVETSFAAALPDRPEALRHFVATPACGLAMRSVLEAERIFEQLRAARSALLR